jgi:hypothetical protein
MAKRTSLSGKSLLVSFEHQKKVEQKIDLLQFMSHLFNEIFEKTHTKAP